MVKVEASKIKRFQLAAIAAVVTERDRQDEKWGVQNHDPDHWVAIMSEEVGEFAKEALEGRTANRYKELLEEAIHMTAVGLAIVECLLRDELAWPGSNPPGVQMTLEGDVTHGQQN